MLLAAVHVLGPVSPNIGHAHITVADTATVKPSVYHPTVATGTSFFVKSQFKIGESSLS
jgi:hypothetical protein